MNSLLARLAALLAWGLVAVGAAQASDIACQPAPQSATARCDDPVSPGQRCGSPPDRRPVAQRMICEYAMLHMGYLRIDDDQRRQLRAGTLRMGDLQAWRRKRDACTSVPCLDAVFAEWWRHRGDRLTAGRPPAQPPSRPVQARPAPEFSAATRPEVPPATLVPVSPPTAESTPALPDAAPVLALTMAAPPDALPQSSLLSSVHDTRPPLPKEEVGGAFANFSTRHAMAWAWLLWLGLLLVASVGLDWVLKRRERPSRAEGQPEAAGAASEVRHRPAIPRVAIVLGTLLALNAILLLAVFVSR
ncbi:hypothetical protein LMG19282_02310 [Cupriavidus campinensis]|uniref:Transmembrane protein n=1 Tax=Cupriavidus campinensis TaxID=151783 RepID=A0AAE9L1W2_9BURK|nr:MULTISPECIES: hypothetical protein [Cupriavidus]TSP12469.1 hypothetical protein FGG12_12845 [Cupriavidus campinensis]URF03345.1 hypothetical protein M5D45_12480 [Cupriavidus campinensis]CAG2142877.1 hypothetical protein LMG19282_02310 [Cupriavidus campinensis]